LCISSLLHEIPGGQIVQGPILFPGSDSEIAVAEDIVHAAADPRTGTLFVAFTGSLNREPGHPSVMVSASTDGGGTWTDPTAVGGPDGVNWRPTLAVSASGTPVVTYYRAARTDPTVGLSPGPEGIPIELVMTTLAWQGDRLQSAPPTVLDRFTWSPRASGAYFLGDYHGLVFAGDTAIAVVARSTNQGSRVVAIRQVVP
jgi:hypothetical protein